MFNLTNYINSQLKGRGLSFEKWNVKYEDGVNIITLILDCEFNYIVNSDDLPYYESELDLRCKNMFGEVLPEGSYETKVVVINQKKIKETI
jgi:hypothetical protein